jgi:hypothetical protein
MTMLGCPARCSPPAGAGQERRHRLVQPIVDNDLIDDEVPDREPAADLTDQVREPVEAVAEPAQPEPLADGQ